jgi:hypothetical protein
LLTPRNTGPTEISAEDTHWSSAALGPAGHWDAALAAVLAAQVHDHLAAQSAADHDGQHGAVATGP